MLRDIHAILDDMVSGPQFVEQEMETVAARRTLFSSADLSDLQTVVCYLENRISFYETLYGVREEAREGLPQDMSIARVPSR